MTVVTSWWWIRHAPVPKHFGPNYGQIDHPCDTSAKAEFAALARGLPRPAVWLHTPLIRTRQTALAVGAEGYDLPELQIEPELIEQHFGDWQGKSFDEIKAESPELHDRFWQAPTHGTPPGGEAFITVMARVAAAVDRLSREHAGRNIVAVAHAGSIRAAVAHALGLPPESTLRLAFHNNHLTRIDHVADRDQATWRVIGLNLPPR